MEFQPFGEVEAAKVEVGHWPKSSDLVTKSDAFVLDDFNFISGLRKQALLSLLKGGQDCLKTVKADLAFDLKIK